MVIANANGDPATITEGSMTVIRVENAYVRGGEAFASGVPREACPFPQDATDRQEWLDGWDEAEQHETADRDPPKR